MSNLAFTIWQNDKTILDLWVSYYSKHFDDLYVITSETREEYYPYLEELRSKYGVAHEISESPKSDPQKTVEYLNQKQKDFLEDHEWVMFSNCDEYLIPDQTKHKTLKNLMRYNKEDTVACMGYEVIQVKGEDRLDYTKPILKQRKYWLRNKGYNKILLTRVPITWYQGCHRTTDMDQEQSMAIDNTGLYLVHLKHADVNRLGGDLGPHKTNLEPWVMEHSKPEDWTEIPENIKDQL